MSDKPTLIFLHGVGSGDPADTWREVLASSLALVGYPSLDDVEVIAPKYAHALRGTDDNLQIPPLTHKAPTGENARRRNRREFVQRSGAVESALGHFDGEDGLFDGHSVVALASAAPFFAQANNYITRPEIRAQVIRRVLDRLPQSGRVVIVGHSLGSVIAADLIRRLPEDVQVGGLITIGSPLASPKLHFSQLKQDLKEPPVNLGWWVNIWNRHDPVAAGHGASALFPWLTDHRIVADFGLHSHAANTYLAQPDVARTVGLGLFGSLLKELAVIPDSLDFPTDYAETMALLALRYVHLISLRLEGEVKERYLAALRDVQSNTYRRIRERNERVGRPLPSAVAALSFDESDPTAQVPEPQRVTHLPLEEAVVALVALACTNLIQPYEISVDGKKEPQARAMEELTIEMGLGSTLGAGVFEATEEAAKALGSGTNWVKWIALGLGAAALIVATGGLMLAAAPGVAGAAAITSALAAFGPGGMIGGLLSAGALVSAGTSGMALGLASHATTAQDLEAVVMSQIAVVILRHRHDLPSDSAVWDQLQVTAHEIRREQARLEPISDKDSRTVKEMSRKLKTIERALTYLATHGYAPIHEKIDLTG